jgi:hypothetical protein
MSSLSGAPIMALLGTPPASAQQCTETCRPSLRARVHRPCLLPAAPPVAAPPAWPNPSPRPCRPGSQAVKANTTYCALHTTEAVVLAVGDLKSGQEAAPKNGAAGSSAAAGLMLLAALLAVLL